VTNRSISTNVMLMDGETIALGGLIKSQEDNTRSFVPILGSIPLLGYLFSSRAQVTRTTELVIYVTPHILNPETQGVNLEEEFESLDRRSGFLKDNDFLGSSKGKKEGKDAQKAEVPTVPPAPVSEIPAPPPAVRPSPDSARAAQPAPARDSVRALPRAAPMPPRNSFPPPANRAQPGGAPPSAAPMPPGPARPPADTARGR
jgi:Flp pilus assembly secretin CpaC